ncbi:ComEA family DNA-binding protein [Corynebacterium accolens]|uniref:ComEA family DNA-binding protein n=1 Tax=Corynebacterium accolens TaxID=38284 RepID=UPI002543BF01|nr:ComEA family DNA-binding protein [Corynebacterium accolens]MDK4280286.1 ComEA family DNA-binding protein [Corynebacterium accolens]MDK8820646.1 ComEA family DNA-binding protein [Corynebacterium accolens]
MASPKISERLREFTQPTGEEELLRVDYPRPRVRISRWQACAVAIMVVVGVIIWLGLSSRDSDESGMPEPAAMESTTAEPSEIVVSVVGEVAAPGLKTLEPGARVADALAAATPLPEAETMTLNQAQRLADGQQLHVLPQGAPLADAPSTAPAGGDKVSLNSATAAELTDLSGVGEVTAEAIVSFREERGGFQDVEELLEVSGIGPAKFAKLKDNVQL